MGCCQSSTVADTDLAPTVFQSDFKGYEKIFECECIIIILIARCLKCSQSSVKKLTDSNYTKVLQKTNLHRRRLNS